MRKVFVNQAISWNLVTSGIIGVYGNICRDSVIFSDKRLTLKRNPFKLHQIYSRNSLTRSRKASASGNFSLRGGPRLTPLQTVLLSPSSVVTVISKDPAMSTSFKNSTAKLCKIIHVPLLMG